MAKGNNVGAFVILSILALGGLGLSGYMFIEDKFLGGDEYVPEHEDKSYKLVGYWDSLGGVGESFNLTFSDNKTSPNEYVSLIDSTTFNLTQEGWYKFTIAAVFISLDPTTYYYVRAFQNGTISELIGYIHDPPATAEHVHMVYYVYCGGGDLIRFTCGSVSVDTFYPTSNQYYNHAYIEYVVSA